jgi:hypothetical protein
MDAGGALLTGRGSSKTEKIAAEKPSSRSDYQRETHGEHLLEIVYL